MTDDRYNYPLELGPSRFPSKAPTPCMRNTLVQRGYVACNTPGCHEHHDQAVLELRMQVELGRQAELKLQAIQERLNRSNFEPVASRESRTSGHYDAQTSSANALTKDNVPPLKSYRTASNGMFMPRFQARPTSAFVGGRPIGNRRGLTQLSSSTTSLTSSHGIADRAPSSLSLKNGHYLIEDPRENRPDVLRHSSASSRYDSRRLTSEAHFAGAAAPQLPRMCTKRVTSMDNRPDAVLEAQTPKGSLAFVLNHGTVVNGQERVLVFPEERCELGRRISPRDPDEDGGGGNGRRIAETLSRPAPRRSVGIPSRPVLRVRAYNPDPGRHSSHAPHAIQPARREYGSRVSPSQATASTRLEVSTSVPAGIIPTTLLRVPYGLRQATRRKNSSAAPYHEAELEKAPRAKRRAFGRLPADDEFETVEVRPPVQNACADGEPNFATSRLGDRATGGLGAEADMLSETPLADGAPNGAENGSEQSRESKSPHSFANEARSMNADPFRFASLGASAAMSASASPRVHDAEESRIESDAQDSIANAGSRPGLCQYVEPRRSSRLQKGGGR